MATGDYATLAEVKTYCEIPTGDTTRDGIINFLIPKISREIDEVCHRHFYPITDAKVHDFQTEQKIWLRDDLDSLTSITNGDGSSFDLTKIMKYPLSGAPYQWLEVVHGSSQWFLWNQTLSTPQQCLTVTGSWGYLKGGTTPSPIVNATVAWISYLLKVGKNAGIKSKTIGDYTVSYSSVLDYLRQGPPNEAQEYISHYVRRRFATMSREVAP